MKKRRFTPLQIIVHIGGWVPLLLLVYDLYTDNLTVNPIQALEQKTGIQALTFLLMSLACTPLASILGWKELLQRRKALGLYGFMYAFLHVSIFLGIDYGFDFNAILGDVGTKSYILIGLAAFLLLLPVAATSFKYFMKRMGKDWKRLHKLVYIISPLVVLHFALSVKADFLRMQGNVAQPLLYGSIALILLILRISTIKKMVGEIRSRIQHIIRSRGTSVTKIETGDA